MERSNQSTGQGSTQGAQGARHSQGSEGTFALDDLRYDIVTLLHKKSKALEAYDKYLRDAQGRQDILALFQEMRQRDLQDAERLEACLRDLFTSGDSTSNARSASAQ